MSATTITVQGRASQSAPAERGTASLAIQSEGEDRESVFSRARDSAGDLRGRLEQMHNSDAGPVTAWTSSLIRVWSERPWTHGETTSGENRATIHHAQIDFTAEFSDFTALARFIEEIAGLQNVAVNGMEWSLTAARREALLAEVQGRAVAEAVARAQNYARALGLNAVQATAIADRGMLANPSGASPLARTAMMLNAADAPADVSLRPQEIVVEAIVDAQFTAS